MWPNGSSLSLLSAAKYARRELVCVLMRSSLVDLPPTSTLGVSWVCIPVRYSVLQIPRPSTLGVYLVCGPVRSSYSIDAAVKYAIRELRVSPGSGFCSSVSAAKYARHVLRM